MFIIIISLVAVVIAPITSFSYPVFGTKRYHRTGNTRTAVPVYNTPYYDEPYIAPAPSYPRYQDENSYYYLPRQESQYFGLPTYRGEYKPTQYYYAHSPSYSYYDDRSEQANPLDDLQEEMLHEDQRDRQRGYSIGQETWYENPAIKTDRLTNVFLKNLMAYNSRMDREQELRNQNSNFEDYGDANEADYYDQSMNNDLSTRKYNAHQQHHFNDYNYNDNVDKDVADLNSLANKHQKQNEMLNLVDQPSQQNYPDYQQDFSSASANDGTYEEEPEYDDAWINWSSKRSDGGAKHTIGLATFSDRKPTVEQHLQKPIVTASTTKRPQQIESSSVVPPAEHGNENGKSAAGNGQKEIVLPRPAQPVRNPFSAPIMEMLTHNAIHDNKRNVKDNSKSGTVYDTIKQLLAMEHNLEKSGTETKMHKRFVSNEESLVHELDGLKRIAA